MKSLEILEHIKNAPSFMGGDDRYKNNIQSHWVFLEDIETIKADLEVLNILKKYLYIVENQIPRTDDYFEILETDLDEMQDDENCDDFHKVKQWLEDNENETQEN